MQKSQKLGKKVFFFKLKWQQNNFWHRNRWERNPKLQVLRTKHLKQSFPVFFAAVNKINNVSKVHFVDNVLLSVQKGQVVHFLLSHGRAQDRFDSLHDCRFILMWEWNSLTLEFGMYPQSMPTEWTHVRTVRPWQSVRLEKNNVNRRLDIRHEFTYFQANSATVLPSCEWKDIAAYYFLRSINRRLDLRSL